MFESLVTGPQRVIIDIPAGHEVTICRTSGVRVHVIRSETYKDMIERFDLRPPHPSLVLERIDINKPLSVGNVRWVERGVGDPCRCHEKGDPDESLDSDDVPDGMGG